ncbi:hypothetical protein G6L15_06900 [Agrobacterium rhizogenes]|uniref:hypothetical protein n=1 Tax=Rhizobium rhizogenes TaxID=359 RepID=UPI001573D3C0|nr:hypothetical protein [Rhizobium rhizogenes]NTG85875.1 hypothetical protein [Rhizobium rhizogenes]
MGANAAYALSRDDVRWCYETLLKRQPESDDVVTHFVENVADLKSLVKLFMGSTEFNNMQKNVVIKDGMAFEVIDGFRYNDSPSVQENVLKILKLMEPVAVEGFYKVRTGRNGDGGYVMLDDFEGIEAAYSLGICDDVSWDLQFADRGIEIYQYDHTIDALPESHPRFHWFKTGIGSERTESLDSLPNLMKANGHEHSRDLLLKCDIEGAEWDMLATMTPTQLSQFRQITLETHGWGDLENPAFADKAYRAIANLTAGHKLIHVHGNNCTALAVVGGIAVPAAMEMTFIRAADKQLYPSTETFPTTLDQPCWPHRADYHLGNFRF